MSVAGELSLNVKTAWPSRTRATGKCAVQARRLPGIRVPAPAFFVSRPTDHRRIPERLSDSRITVDDHDDGRASPMVSAQDSGTTPMSAVLRFSHA
jgi:hypothetical protein